MNCPTQQQVEAHYRQAARQMHDLPLYNPALTVAMQGWQSLEMADLGLHDYQPRMGILITPWCMNLWVGGLHPAVHPAAGSDWLLRLAQTEYRLTMAHHQSLGLYASGSLISMMKQFVDMSAAHAFAAEVLSLLQSDETQPALMVDGSGSDQAENVTTPERGTVDLARRGFLSALRSKRRL
jgi:[NiFe] hydrogenase assembly HybE family chaperone